MKTSSYPEVIYNYRQPMVSVSYEYGEIDIKAPLVFPGIVPKELSYQIFANGDSINPLITIKSKTTELARAFLPQGVLSTEGRKNFILIIPHHPDFSSKKVTFEGVDFGEIFLDPIHIVQQPLTIAGLVSNTLTDEILPDIDVSIFLGNEVLQKVYSKNNGEYILTISGEYKDEEALRIIAGEKLIFSPFRKDISFENTKNLKVLYPEINIINWEDIINVDMIINATSVGLNKGEKLDVSILDGKCKLQWKVDWAMRWYALDVDFEMYGKDLIESAILSTKIVKLLGKKNPSGFAYELFLDEKGEKISKSKGNGVTIEEWLKYASPESLSLFMFQNPKRAKKLYKEIVPKAVDEYLDCIEKSKNQSNKEILLNPVWHVHNGNIPDEKKIMSYSMLLNLVETSNANSKDVLWKFVERYAKDLNKKDYPIFDKLIEYSITYFNDIAKSNKKYKNPNNEEKKALLNLIKMLENSPDNLEPEDIQTNIYTVGKENGYKENLRDWFKLIYEVVFGVENGPRLGFFISFFGVKNTIKLIKEKIN